MKRFFVVTWFILTLLFGSLIVLAQSQSREEVLKAIETKRAELSALEQRFLSPTEEDRALYAAFLKLPKTGLIRILPRETYDSHDKPTMTIRGGGAYYSFTKRTHEYGSSTDIGLEQGQLKVGFAGADYGMLTNIGNVPLENVSLETPAARILAAHNPATEEPQARVEQRRASEGTIVEGVTFKNRLPLRLNSTYLVRTVNYYESDALVAFRVVRIDTDDDSAIILWKLLMKYPVPQLDR
jgi:hypothetical protein